MPGMYLDAMEFLEEERDAWAPFEALADLTDEQLSSPVEAAHGWSGRDLMAHLLAWQEVALRAAKELAVNETSDTFARSSADWDARGGEVVNAEIEAAWGRLPMAEVRDRFATQPGELRGYLTVVPETRWLKHAENLESFRVQTMEHYEEHADDLAAILASAGSA
jgi:Mycothiol maleylpyruvate isomerase N-terminal domain